MQYFSSDGVDIAYLDQGHGQPVLLIHGFASTSSVNWVSPGWVNLLERQGYRLLVPDNRGHGKSQKLYDPKDYAAPVMATDVRHLLDHLDIEKAHVMGYSMGARIATFLAMSAPERVQSIILGGVGSNLLEGLQGPDNTLDIVAAMEAEDPASITTQVGVAFRSFADANSADLKALSACIQSSRTPIRVEDLERIYHPVLLAVGTQDTVAGKVAPLLQSLPSVEYLPIPDRDHMRAVGDSTFKKAVVEFLQKRS